MRSRHESVALPDFRLSGRNSPSDPANVDLEAATVRSLLIQLANFSLDFHLVKDECFVENTDSDTYTVDRAKVVALFQDFMSIHARQGGWRLPPTKTEVEQMGQFISGQLFSSYFRRQISFCVARRSPAAG